MAVEDELVLPSDEVAEREVGARVARTRDEHLLAVLRLADVERRGRQVHDQLRARQREIRRGRAGLPDVLADRDADGHVSEPKQHEVAAGCEVAVLVEHAVVREEVLAVDALHAAVRADGARIREVEVEPGRADERDDAVRRGRDLLDRRSRCADESRAQQEILGRIAGCGELGKDDEVRTRGSGALEILQDPRPVSVEVSDDDIDLRQRDSQGFRLTVTNRV